MIHSTVMINTLRNLRLGHIQMIGCARVPVNANPVAPWAKFRTF